MILFFRADAELGDVFDAAFADDEDVVLAVAAGTGFAVGDGEPSGGVWMCRVGQS